MKTTSLIVSGVLSIFSPQKEAPKPQPKAQPRVEAQAPSMAPSQSLNTPQFTTSGSTKWKITKTSWTEDDERDFSRFVNAIGTAVEQGICGTTSDCIRTAPGNFLRTQEDMDLNIHVDCADLPYALRAYFAAKRGLPFSFASAVDPVPAPEGETLRNTDVRYSTYGNQITRRTNISKGPYAFTDAWVKMMNSISSAMYRVHPQYDSSELPQDFYSVDIRKADEYDIRGIRPGTIIYDPAGHVAVVYKISSSGRIFFIDAHPDNSLTRGSYGMKFSRSRPHAGAGFKNFRPLSIENGKVVLARNTEISDYSTVQYFGTNPPAPGESWSKGTFTLAGEKLLYIDYVRAVMAGGNVTIDPISEVTEMTDALCLDVKDRIRAVSDAVQAGLHRKPHVSRLPYNIYGTSGEWEEYSTPSRDARLKTSFKELTDSASLWLSMYQQKSNRIRYSGYNMAGDMLNAYNSVVKRCRLGYTNSSGNRVSFSLNDVVDNLWSLSFSPYHCPELRWGGIGGVPGACKESDKITWFKAQRKLRNQIERTYETRMNYTANELLTGAGSKLGVETPPLVDIRKVLQ